VSVCRESGLKLMFRPPFPDAPNGDGRGRFTAGSPQ
jgi:hypothetical protein